MLNNLKLKAYHKIIEENYFVKKNYENYVRGNYDYHKNHKFKSWIYLLKLIVKYRILKKTTIVKKEADVRLPYMEGSESSLLDRVPPHHFVKVLLEYDIISFDIFDTLILRPFASPEDLFILVGEELNCMNFLQIRKECEKEARNKKQVLLGTREVTIDDIYEIIEERTGIDKELGKQTEFNIEMDLCFANPYMQRVYNLLIQQGKKIIAISDMYYPAEMLNSLLNKCGYNQISDIYVSCDYLCNKHIGGLYKIVISKLNINPSKVIHVGDNYKSDVEMAVKAGLNSRYYANCHEVGNEYRADGISKLTKTTYAGVVNTKLHNGIGKFSPYYEYGYIYGGLYIFGFCNWIYNTAKLNSVDKIIFLSRDGDIYQRVFEMMYKDMPTVYGLWSRTANLRATLKYNKEQFLERMIRHKSNSVIPISIECLCENLSCSELCFKLKKYGLSDSDIICNDNRKVIERFFIENWDFVVEKNEIYSKNVKDYYINELGNCKKVAIVDVGWLGTGPIGLKQLLEPNYECICLLAASASNDQSYNMSNIMNNSIHTYLFSSNYNRNHYDYHLKKNKGLNNQFFEIFTQSCTPSFLGIDENKQFLFDIAEVENYDIIRQVHDGVYEFCCDYFEKFKKYPYIFNISGYDAYCPFRMIIRKLTFFRKFFADFTYARTVGNDLNNFKLETLKESMLHDGLWEE